jgi:uncharacterized protein YceH (UPF0502 family)
VEADAVEIRVLGSLIEKQRLTPDVYPLTLNALRLACNQSTNRDPVVEYDEATIRGALDRLSSRRWARLAGIGAGRAPKYRHLLDEALGLAPPEMALLAALMLRGEQTPGELKARTERMHAFAGREAVERALEGLAERGLVARRPRRPGQKEERYAQLLGGGRDEAPAAPGPAPPAAAAAPPAPAVTEPSADGAAERLDRLEREVAELRADLAALRRDLG